MSSTYDSRYHFKNQDTSSTTHLRDPQDRLNSPGPVSNAPYSAANNYGRPYSVPPPPYPGYIKPASSGSKWLPRNWSRKRWFGVVLGAVVLLLIIIVGAVEGTKAVVYPDYSRLNYNLVDTYIGANFFDSFEYFIGYDPTQGFVHYSNPAQSVNMNLTYASETSAVLRVDNRQKNASTGRHSARIFSKAKYDDGLFIFDIVHSPYGCASWPAVWLTDQNNWPTNGEIDVVEAVNRATNGNQMTLHTTDDCSMNVKREQFGTALGTNCFNGTDNNEGCAVQGPKNSVGASMNAAGGGVYAMELRAAGIRMWFFPRDQIPTDIATVQKPQPEKWGQALADFPSTDCDIASHFKSLSITVDIDVCGDLAGAPQVYTKEGNCPGVCSTYAATHPEAFDESYWEFNSFRVYQAKGSN